MITPTIDPKVLTNELDHDFSMLNEMVLPLIQQVNDGYRHLWVKLDEIMKNAFLELGMELQFSQFKQRILQLYWSLVKFILSREVKKGNNLKVMEQKIGKLNSLLFKNPDIKLPYL